MTILNQSSAEMSTETKYRLTMSPEIEKLSNVKGKVISIKNWIQYEDVKTKDGEDKKETILSIETDLGEVFATNSVTFMDTFFDMLDLFESNNEFVKYVKIGTGTSKNGRDYITAIYAASPET